VRTSIRREDGFTLIEMLIVLGIISILAAMATVTLAGSTSRAYVVSMQSDLRNVATAQEAYIEQRFAETGQARYANRVGDLSVNLSNGVRIRMRGNQNGWSALATHQRVSGEKCAVFRGTIKAFPPATAEGVIACD